MYATVPPSAPLVCFPRPLRVVWVVGCLGFRCIDMKGFRVEDKQLGAAQTETVAHQVSVATLDMRRSCIASKVTTLARIPGSGPLPVTVGTFETKVTTLTRISGVYHGGKIPCGAGVPTRDTSL